MKVSDVEVGKTYKLLRHGERVVYKTIVIAARGDDKFLCVTLDPLNKRGRLFLLSVKKEITKRIRVLSSNRFIRAIALTIERAYPPEPKVVDEVVSAQE